MSVNTEVAPPKRGKAELAEQISFTDQQLELMKNTVARGVGNDEFLLFLHLAKTYGLDPFAKEIWCIKYGTNPATIFTSRDGYLKIASRDKQMNGIVSDAVCANDTVERLADGHVQHTYGNPRGELVGAYALVHRKDRAYPAYFYAPFKEYNAGSNPTWKKYPTAMIIKVAEAMALKRAFSISGLVTQEEIGLEMVPAPQEAETSAVVEVEESPAKQPAGNGPAATASPSPAPSPTFDQSAANEAKMAGHRTRMLYARSLAEVQQIWSEVPRHLQQALVADKDAAKVRLAKSPGEKPIQDAELVREFAEQPAIGGGELASGDQRQEITRLLNLPVITPLEKKTLLVVVSQLDKARAGQAIYRLRNAIADREGRDPDKETRQALHRFASNYSEQLGSDEVARLIGLAEAQEWHWQALYDELLHAKARLQAVPA